MESLPEMNDYTGGIVRATAGRDKGGLFCVLGTEGEFLLLADGKRRKVTRPKRKKPGHVETLTDTLHPYDHPVVQRLRRGEEVTNNDIRRALAAFPAKEV